MTTYAEIACRGKVALTRERALAVVKRSKRARKGSPRRSVYRCAICRHWHVGALDPVRKSKADMQHARRGQDGRDHWWVPEYLEDAQGHSVATPATATGHP